MARFAAVALLALLAVSAVAAEKRQGMLLGDFLRSGKKSNTPVRVSSGYKSIDWAKIEFGLANFQNCRNSTDGTETYRESLLVCPSRAYGRYAENNFNFAANTIGSCAVTRELLSSEITLLTPPHVSSMVKTGTWTARCQLSGHVDDTCAEPLCDGAIIVASGDIYEMTGVLVEGSPNAPSKSNDCAALPASPFVASEAKVATASAGGKKPAYDDYVEGVFYEGQAELLFGTVQSITTPDHSIPLTGDGYFQLVDAWKAAGNLPFTGNLDEKLIVQPYTIQLKLEEEAEYQKY